MSDADRVQKAEQDAMDDISEDSLPALGALKPNSSSTIAAGDVVAPTNRSRARAAMNANMQTELSVAAKLQDAFESHYTIEIGVEVKRGSQRHQMDMVARPAVANARWYVFEIKRIMSSFGKNYRHRITEGISQAVMGAEMLGQTAVTPVAIVVYDVASPAIIEKANAYGEAFANSFSTRPVFLLLSATDLDEMSPAALSARIHNSRPD